MKTNYVFIDYENIQPATLSILDQEHFRILAFIGASQTKISFDVVSTLQKMGSRAEYIKVTSNGSNALDFHIAFYIGQFAVKDPNAYFHIISKDTGFDPLIQHLRDCKISVGRFSDITDIPAIKVAQPISKVATVASTSLAGQVAAIVAHLQKYGPAKPRTVKTLSSTINTAFQKKISQEAVGAIIRELQKAKIIAINEEKITYL